MAKIEDCPGFETFGADVKAARKAKRWARRTLAEMVSIDYRYLANIENKGTIPSVPVVIQLESPGFLLQESGLRNLKHLASIRGKIGIDEIRQSMTTVGLDPDLKRPVGKYSLGMRQRLGIAQAIMEQPDLLILDEPMNGLDNQGVEHIRSVLLSLKEKGVTIVLASHFKEDISYLCDEVYQMDAGTLTQMT